ncbi:MAG: hypothetical protein WC269_02840 [Candidatus Gracilibacteria bacterium]|jgi:hypothetical protein
MPEDFTNRHGSFIDILNRQRSSRGSVDGKIPDRVIEDVQAIKTAFREFRERNVRLGKSGCRVVVPIRREDASFLDAWTKEKDIAFAGHAGEYVKKNFEVDLELGRKGEIGNVVSVVDCFAARIRKQLGDFAETDQSGEVLFKFSSDLIREGFYQGRRRLTKFILEIAEKTGVDLKKILIQYDDSSNVNLDVLGKKN